MLGKAFDIVIVGGGVMGTSIFAHLADHCTCKTALVEQTMIGTSGPTAKSGGMLRTYHRDPYLSDLAFDSMPAFINFEDYYGSGCGYQPSGLIVVEPADRLAEVNREVARINSRQAVLDIWRGEERASLHAIPFATGRQDLIIYEARAGYASPGLTAQAWVQHGRNAGLAAYEGVAVTEVAVENGKVTGLVTSAGTVEARAVVIAAGAWSKELLERATGCEAPLRAKAIQMSAFLRPPQASVPLPFTDYTSELYGKPEGSSVFTIGMPVDEWDIDPRHEYLIDPVLTQQVRQCAADRFHWVSGAEWAGGKRSFDAYTQDGRGWFGRVEGVDGLYVCTGWSGGGFKVAPAVGKRIANEISDSLGRDYNI